MTENTEKLLKFMGQEAKKHKVTKGTADYNSAIARLKTMLKAKKSVVTFVNSKPVKLSLNADGSIKEEFISAN